MKNKIQNSITLVVKTLFIVSIWCFGCVVFAQKKIKSNTLYTIENQVFTLDSIPLEGFYEVKRNKAKEVSYFKKGYRFGVSKNLKFNKLEEEGSYVKGLKHGIWNRYHHFNGNLFSTVNYKNGLKHGKEINYEYTYHGRHVRDICNYVNDTLDGAFITYNYWGVLESKTVYKKGEKQYKHIYDEFLNIEKKEHYTNKKDSIVVKQKIEKIKDDVYIDSVFYKINKYNKKHAYLNKTYKNNTMIFKAEILVEQDTTRTEQSDKVFYINAYNGEGDKSSIFIFYDSNKVNLNDIVSSVIDSKYRNPFKPCDVFYELVFAGVDYFTIYHKDFSNSILSYTYEEKKEEITDCYPSYFDTKDGYKQIGFQF